MELQSESFDAVAYEVEAHLRELRRLVGETVFLSDAQNEVLNTLKDRLRVAGLYASSMRTSLLTGADPQSIESLHEDRKMRENEQQAQNELEILEKRLGLQADPPKSRFEDPLGGGNPPSGRGWNADDFEGGASLPAVPKKPTPVFAGGAARTFEEADELPRDP